MATPNIEKIRQAKSYSNGFWSALQTMEPELSIRRKNEIPEAMSAICNGSLVQKKNKEPINW